MAPEMSKDENTSSSVLASGFPIRQKMSLFAAQVTLRISTIVFTLIAICVTVTNTQSVSVFGFKVEAHYNYSTAFQFLVGANAVVCAFSALSLISVCLLLSPSASPQQLKNYFFLFLHDTLVMVLMISGCAAATAIGYVGKYGEKKMTWQPTCGYVSKYCNRMSISLAFSYLAFFAYLLLTFISAHNLMSRPNTR